MADADDRYFASLAMPDEQGNVNDADKEDYVQELSRKVSNFYNFYASCGLFDRDKRAYMTLYGLSPEGNGVSYKVSRGGQNGQLTFLKVNQWANLIQHQASLITAKRPGLDVRATNADTASLEQSKLGGDVLEHQVNFLDMEATTREMTKMSLALRESWLWTRWNADAGDDFAPDENGKMQKTGSLEISMHFGQDVIREYASLGNKPKRWLILREFVNRYDLAAKWPEYEDEILAYQRQGVDAYRLEFQAEANERDDIPVYHFWHAKTGAVPDGRSSVFLEGGCLLSDGPIGYDGKCPILDMSPARILGTPFGYSPSHDLLALQHVYDALVSGAITNEIAFAVRRMLVPRGQPVSPAQLSSDLGVIYYDGSLDKPSMLETPLNSSERFEAISQIERLMQTLSGINDVIRGNGEGAGTKAASGLALLQNQALQFLSGLEFEYGHLWRRWGELCLSMLRERASAPQMIAIAGKQKQAALKSFLGKDLANSYRVSVDLGDPMAKTAAGREARADGLMQAGLLGPPGDPQTVANFFEVTQTGTLQRVMDEATAEKDLIERENEALMRGEVPPVSEWDSHPLHMVKNAMVAFTHEFRDEEQKEQAGGLNPMTGQPVYQSPMLGALRQHLLMHRMAQQQQAAVQNAQAAQLAAQQMAQAPGGPAGPQVPPGPSQGPSGPPPGGHKPPMPNSPPGNPIQAPRTAEPPPSAMPTPGVQ